MIRRWSAVETHQLSDYQVLELRSQTENIELILTLFLCLD